MYKEIKNKKWPKKQVPGHFFWKKFRNLLIRPYRLIFYTYILISPT